MKKRTIYRDGEKREAHRDKEARREAKRSIRKYKQDLKRANYRAKFGPTGKPAPVEVRIEPPEASRGRPTR